MPAATKSLPILFISSDSSYFANLETDAAQMALSDLAKIDFPLIQDGKVHKEHLTQALSALGIKKLHVVISDDIFFHHITDYTPNSSISLEKHISKTVSEVFDQHQEPLHVVTLDLAKTSKLQTVQITATTKENLSTIKQAANQAQVQIESLIPASFVVKAFVSVDPSLFILQTPQSFLLTSHYIGVDFASRIEGSAVADLVAEIKKLKAEHPHLQHSYLSLEQENKELVTAIEAVLPTQKVEIRKIEAEPDTPVFFKLITVGYKEVTENEFPLPQFDLELVDASQAKAALSTPVKQEISETPTLPTQVSAQPEEQVVSIEPPLIKPVLPNPVAATAIAATTTITTPPPVTIQNVEKLEQQKTGLTQPPIQSATPSPVITPSPVVVTANNSAVTPSISTPATTNISTLPAVPKTHTTPTVQPSNKVTINSVTPTSVTSAVETISKPSNTIQPTPLSPSATPEKKPNLQKSGALNTKKKSGVLSYVFLAIGIAVLISLIGGGVVISQGALKERTSLQTPIAQATPTPDESQAKPTSTPSPTPEPVELSELSVLVVNATTISGRAGKIATALKAAGFTTVDTGNAKDTYDTEGIFVMASDDVNQTVVEAIQDATKLTLESTEFSTTEDPNKKYDYVIVINE